VAVTRRARLADGWLPTLDYLQPGELAAGNARIGEAASDAGRHPGDIRRLLNISGRFGPGGNGLLDGPPGARAEQLADLALTDGVSTFILASDDPDDIRAYAADVAPAVRELVAAARAGTGPAGGADSPARQPAEVPAAAGEPGVEPTPDDLTELQDLTDLLTDTLLSRLAYEERELIEPLARYGFYDEQIW
jgi:hypothetical protein